MHRAARAVSAKLGNSVIYWLGSVLPIDVVYFLSLCGGSLSRDHSTRESDIICRVISNVAGAQQDVMACCPTTTSSMHLSQ